MVRPKRGMNFKRGTSNWPASYERLHGLSHASVSSVVTLCLDDSSIESYSLSGTARRKWVLPDRRRDFHWERARKKFGLTGDDVYDDDDADQWAQEQMLIEAIAHW